MPTPRGQKLTIDLVQDLNPLVDGFAEMLEDYEQEHGDFKNFDVSAALLDLKMQAAETGFALGVLAGAIFSGAGKEQLNRLERGLACRMSFTGTVKK